MPRRSLIRTSDFFYHVTLRCNNKEWFDLPLTTVWRLLCVSMTEAKSVVPVEVHLLLVMNNHYHLLVRTPDANLDKFMFELNRRFSQRIRFVTYRINRIFGDRYKWSLIENEKYYLNVFRYILQNPLRSGAAFRCEVYPYSTFFELINAKSCCVDTERLPFKLNVMFCDWLNQKISEEEKASIMDGLSRPVFKSPLRKIKLDFYSIAK